VKPAIPQDENSRKEFIAQAAAYAFHFLLRVFPMISEENLIKIFPDRCVYTLLLSHKELILIKVDVSDFLITGKPTCYYSETFSVKGKGNETYFKYFARWIKWATDVAMNLRNLREVLNGLKPINCWVPVSSYIAEFENEINEEMEKENQTDPFKVLEPDPSFFNPIYKTKSRYYRVFCSFWCCNCKSNFGFFRSDYPYLFSGYKFPNYICLSCPNYGDPLTHFKQKVTFANLKLILTHILTILKDFRPYCHMDIRAPNVIVKENEGKHIQDVHLIDFDFSRKIKDTNPMARSTLEYPPETNVHQNSDMWSVGIMTWKLVSDTVSQDQLTESSFAVKESFEVKENFRDYSSDLYDFISKCVVDKPEKRLSIDDGLELLNKWNPKPLNKDLSC
jgi:serine/threonine protein kinase